MPALCGQLVLALISIGALVAFIGSDRKGHLERTHPVVFPAARLARGDAGECSREWSFVNPDHFANFLAMILPLAIVGAIFPMP